MRFTVTMKSPAYKACLNTLDTPDRRASMANYASKWIEYGEYLTVMIDTKAGTCKVLPVDD